MTATRLSLDDTSNHDIDLQGTGAPFFGSYLGV